MISLACFTSSGETMKPSRILTTYSRRSACIHIRLGNINVFRLACLWIPTSWLLLLHCIRSEESPGLAYLWPEFRVVVHTEQGPHVLLWMHYSLAGELAVHWEQTKKSEQSQEMSTKRASNRLVKSWLIKMFLMELTPKISRTFSDLLLWSIVSYKYSSW